MSLRLAPLVIVLLFMASGYGCATVVNGTTQQISVTTDPCGADCRVDNTARYTTPCKVELKRKVDHKVEISKDGYEPETVTVKHSVSPVVLGNALAGGLIGIGVDAANGAACKLAPDEINITMKAVPKPEPLLEPEPAAVAPEPPKNKNKDE